METITIENPFDARLSTREQPMCSNEGCCFTAKVFTPVNISIPIEGTMVSVRPIVALCTKCHNELVG